MSDLKKSAKRRTRSKAAPVLGIAGMTFLAGASAALAYPSLDQATDSRSFTRSTAKAKVKAKAERAAFGLQWVHAAADAAPARPAGAEIITDTARRRFSTTLMRRLNRSGPCENIGALTGEPTIAKDGEPGRACLEMAYLRDEAVELRIMWAALNSTVT